MEQVADAHTTPDPADPITDHKIDWLWPDIDTFTDDEIARRTSQTCSELGSQRIRLVRIRPGPPNSIIKLDVKICFLAHAEEYTALSYTWGSSTLQHQVIVDDQPRLLTTNLCRFFSQARRLLASYSGWLWIDALSIDQSDPWEKLEQVKIISQIFTSAKRTVIWLGPAYGDSDRVMKAVSNIPLSSSSRKSSRAMWAAHLWPAVLGFCERTYWRRLWVFQELRASQTIDVLCGSLQVNFEYLKDFLLREDESEKRTTHPYFSCLRSSSAMKMVQLTCGTLDTSLRSMLDATSHLLCTDTRDKVYGILNMVTSGHQGIEADYTLALPKLLNSVLRNMHECQRPAGLNEVADQCLDLERVFSVEPGSIYQCESLALKSCSMITMGSDWEVPFGWTKNLEQNLILRDYIVDVHTWCKSYGHRQIGSLLYEDLIFFIECHPIPGFKNELDSEIRLIVKELYDLWRKG